jgi:hypothetical protein
MAEISGAHAAVIRIGETDYRVRHTLEIGCRIEERFGPLRVLAQRVEILSLTIREFLDLYRIAFSEVPNPPAEDAFRAHINRFGITGAVKDLQPILARLFMGEEQYVALVTKRASGENPPIAPA